MIHHFPKRYQERGPVIPTTADERVLLCGAVCPLAAPKLGKRSDGRWQPIQYRLNLEREIRGRLGVTEPTLAWGLMLSGNAADFYREAPWMILFPGAAISLAVFAFNLFGDALRDYLDPRFKT